MPHFGAIVQNQHKNCARREHIQWLLAELRNPQCFLGPAIDLLPHSPLTRLIGLFSVLYVPHSLKSGYIGYVLEEKV